MEPIAMAAAATLDPRSLPPATWIRYRAEIPEQTANGPKTIPNGQMRTSPTMLAANAVLAAGSYTASRNIALKSNVMAAT
jgi:hypothetical protein